jgi:hypothetical protein
MSSLIGAQCMDGGEHGAVAGLEASSSAMAPNRGFATLPAPLPRLESRSGGATSSHCFACGQHRFEVWRLVHE